MSLLGQEFPRHVDPHFEQWRKNQDMSDYRGLIAEIDADNKAKREAPKVAARDNTGKPKLGYFARSFPKVQEAIARVKEFGANKYDDGNWRIGGKPDAEYLDSFARHLDLWLSGEVYDQDSGCHHIGHMVWNLCALYELNYKDVPVIDEPLFRERMAFWKDKREAELGQQAVLAAEAKGK